MVEINVAIVCASVPALKPLFTYMRYPITSTSGSRPSYQKSSRFSSNQLSAVRYRAEDVNRDQGGTVLSTYTEDKDSGNVVVGSATTIRTEEERRSSYGNGSREAIFSHRAVDEESPAVALDSSLDHDR
jgi:hypothetical protein